MPLDAASAPRRVHNPWIGMLAPSLALLVVYATVLARPAYVRQCKQYESAQALGNKIAALEQQKQQLIRALGSVVAQTQPAQDTARDATVANDLQTRRVQPVTVGDTTAGQSTSPAQLSGKILKFATDSGVKCLASTHFTPEESEQAATDLRLEMVGSYPGLAATLEQVASQLQHVALTSLRMNRQPSGDCRWQLDLQFQRVFP